MNNVDCRTSGVFFTLRRTTLVRRLSGRPVHACLPESSELSVMPSSRATAAGVAPTRTGLPAFAIRLDIAPCDSPTPTLLYTTRPWRHAACRELQWLCGAPGTPPQLYVQPSHNARRSCKDGGTAAARGMTRGMPDGTSFHSTTRYLGVSPSGCRKRRHKCKRWRRCSTGRQEEDSSRQ
jgi:hypothetical protein